MGDAEAWKIWEGCGDRRLISYVMGWDIEVQGDVGIYGFWLKSTLQRFKRDAEDS